ncbi:hypothetical protein HZA86_05065 [Candidatus Uhrbacteria bacterium]|nr:hypothetical protein [Candidatus Uhrbacteria bacterium]
MASRHGSAKYWHIFSASFREKFDSRGTIVTYGIMWSVRVIVLLLIYSFAFRYRGGSPVNGITLPTALWSMAIYFIVLSFDIRWLYRAISRDIRLGTIEVKITKPYHYVLYHASHNCGRGSASLLFVLFITIAVLPWLAGFPPVVLTGQIIVAGTLLLFMGSTIAILLYSAIGLSAVWLHDADPLYWIMDKTIMVLGGSFVPMALFPPSVRWFAEHSPWGATMFITQIVNPDFIERWPQLALSQIFWVMIMAAITGLIAQQANKRLSIHGG